MYSTCERHQHKYDNKLYIGTYAMYCYYIMCSSINVEIVKNQNLCKGNLGTRLGMTAR